MRALNNYIDRKNTLNSIFSRKEVVRPTNFEETKQLFVSVASDLSPENLACDGECSRSEVQRKFNHLSAVWRDLERIAGREVDESEVWDWAINENVGL